MRQKTRLLTFAAVLMVLTELLGAVFVTMASGPVGQLSPPLGLPNFPANGYASGSGLAPLAGGSLPGGQRIGFWIADDDIFTTGSVYGLPALPWTPQQFYNFYFNTPPFPATMLWASGLVSSGAASVPSDQEAQWLSQVASIADGHPNILILMLLFVNLSGNSIETTVASHSQCFTVGRVSPLTQFTAHNCLTADTQYTINLNDPNNAFVAIIGTATTNSTGGFSAQLAIPNEPQNNGLWNIVVSGTSLYAQVALQSDQQAQLTSYMNILKGHSSIYGALFEPEYFGDTPQIEASFRSIVTGAGYQNLAGVTNANGDPILSYSSYPYFGGALDTVAQTNQIGVHYGETGQPIPPDPQPIWTQSTVTNIVDNSVPLPCTIIISSNDVNNPAGNTYLWASPTLRGWIQNDPNYQAKYLTSNSAVSTTSTTSSTTSMPSTSSAATTTTATSLPSSAPGMVFSSYIAPPSSAQFAYGQNFRTPGASFTLQIPTTSTINMIAFYLSDRAYDPNPVPFTITGPGVSTTGILPGLPMFASQQYYPVQLTSAVTLQANTPYTVSFAQLPSGDNYGCSSTCGISQDIIQEASQPGVSYLGQSQWPLFQVGLMNLMAQSQGLAYRNYGGYTDLFSSPGYMGNGEIAMEFKASQNEQLTLFEINIWSSTGSGNINFALRPDAGNHPATAASNIASVSVAASSMTPGTFAQVPFPNAPLTGGTFYWIVMSASSGQPVVFGRLVNPYRQLVLESHDDFTSSWGVPSDGPSDLGFRITTTGESIVNTVSGSSDNNYLSGVAQSFVPSGSVQIEGAWLSAWPSGEAMTVSIQTDNGNDQPSGTLLTSGTDTVSTQFTGGDPAFVYVGFSVPASLNPGTKYWLVATIGPCLSQSGCSSPSKAATIQFRSDYPSSGFAPPSGTHYEIMSGSAWTSPSSAGAMTFALVSPVGGVPPPVTTTTISSSSSTTTSFLSSSSSSSSASYTSSITTSTALVTTTSTTSTTTTSTVLVASTSTTGVPFGTSTSTQAGQTASSTSSTRSSTASQGTTPSASTTSSSVTSIVSNSFNPLTTISTSAETSSSGASGTSAILFPTASSLAIFTATMGLIVVGLVVVVRLRHYKQR